MSYDYQTERPKLFTDEGQRMFLAWRAAARVLLDRSEAFTFEALQRAASTGGDSWTMLACVDRMVELGELVLLPRPGYAAQSQVYVRGSLR